MNMEMIETDKLILDACCGGRHFWFDKYNPDVLYIDIRVEEKGHNNHRPNHCIKPDLVADFRKLPFKNNQFRHIIWDPPHIIGLSMDSRFGKTYGSLSAETWQSDLKRGFAELWRVLDTHGTLIFKWNEYSVPLKKILKLFHIKPLYGHVVGSKNNTVWCAFFKNE
jgi:SAM-dependent methyltransferase